MIRYAPLLLLLAVMACERGEVTTCVARDPVLSKALVRPDYLPDLGARVRVNEVGAGDEGLDLLLRFVDCLPDRGTP